MTANFGKAAFSRRQFIVTAGMGAVATLLAGARSLASPLASSSRAKSSVSSLAAATGDVLPDYVTKRAAGLVQLDASAAVKNAAHNPEIIAIYADFLGSPLSAKSKSLLHTTYTAR